MPIVLGKSEEEEEEIKGKIVSGNGLSKWGLVKIL